MFDLFRKSQHKEQKKKEEEKTKKYGKRAKRETFLENFQHDFKFTNTFQSPPQLEETIVHGIVFDLFKEEKRKKDRRGKQKEACTRLIRLHSSNEICNLISFVVSRGQRLFAFFESSRAR